MMLREYAASYPFRYDNDQIPDLLPTLQCHYPDPEGAIGAWARQFLDPGESTPTEELLIRITRAIKERFRYRERAIHGTQTPAETLQLGSGTCRDFALFMIEAVRSLGLAARFVTGYLYDPALDGEGPGLEGAGATHAWVQVYLPGAGWVEFDPTNGLIGGTHLIRVGVARDPRQAVPAPGQLPRRRRRLHRHAGRGDRDQGGRRALICRPAMGVPGCGARASRPSRQASGMGRPSSGCWRSASPPPRVRSDRTAPRRVQEACAQFGACHDRDTDAALSAACPPPLSKPEGGTTAPLEGSARRPSTASPPRGSARSRRSTRRSPASSRSLASRSHQARRRCGLRSGLEVRAAASRSAAGQAVGVALSYP